MTTISQSHYNVLLFSMGEKMTEPRSQDHLPTPQQALRISEKQVAETEQSNPDNSMGKDGEAPRDYAQWAEAARRYGEAARGTTQPEPT